MDLYLAGGIHDDPLCRPRLVEWLGPLVERLGPPAFVAVEMEAGISGLLRVKRATFKQLAGGLWGDAVHPIVVAALADTMAWEVDAHRAVLANLEPIFLDEPGGRSDAIDPDLHLGLMSKHLAGFAADRTSVAEVTNYVSQQATQSAEANGLLRLRDPDFRKTQAAREAEWVKKLRRELHGEGWGMGVMGALHASRFDGQTFRSLVEVGPAHLVDVVYLTWRPPQGIA